MGLMAMLLAACGIGGSDGPQAPKVASGEAGLTQVRDESVALLRALAPKMSEASTSTVDSATGAYEFTGYSGKRAYYAYSGEVDLVDGTFDADSISQIMQAADLDVSTYEDPNGDSVVLGRGGGISATARNRPGDSTIRLQVTRTGALVEVKTAERRAELRKETPIDLG